MKTALFDIDGTLANIEHRRPLLAGQRPDWKSFNASMGADTPNFPVVELYKALWDSGKYQLILVSGRGEEHRKLTETWLTWNEIPFERLLLRPENDFRPDVEIKQEILNLLRSEGKEISFVVDDRNSVVEMWRRNKVTCLQCAEGNF
ncbi:phosphatase domain-containing protein [Tritonibacter mobilis]|uniref:phosphatase domain-containing protein n=1 Tax=Tritonibacter mobilis TaxID=379347 RepID=UPI000806CEEC|nr:HAD family acid phosphatase [Tritonibacter mobilis]